jgi:hypothetical protein
MLRLMMIIAVVFFIDIFILYFFSYRFYVAVVVGETERDVQ